MSGLWGGNWWRNNWWSNWWWGGQKKTIPLPTEPIDGFVPPEGEIIGDVRELTIVGTVATETLPYDIRGDIHEVTIIGVLPVEPVVTGKG